MTKALWIILGAIALIIWLYIAARVITRGIIRTNKEAKERKDHEQA